VYFSNLGCKLNQAELEALAREFLADGHEVAPSLEAAELHVINSCTVTGAAARDSRKLARRGRRRNSQLLTVLTGCYVESDPEEAAELVGVDLVVPNTEKSELVERVYDRFPSYRPRANASSDENSVPCGPNDFGHSRALVKIEDGCNMNCSFCIIPSTRGTQRSRSDREIVREVESLAVGGFREVVITGVQISSYRYEKLKLYDLVGRILDETSVERLRLTSIAPWQFDERLLSLFASGRVCRHFHLSLQSGSSATLARMRRPYGADGFSRLVDQIRAAVPGVAITTDVIVGFPGETDEEFEESLEFVSTTAFARTHAFPYSERPGTEAADLPDPVPHPLKRERMKRMLEVASRAERNFHRAQLGRSTSVLWEARKPDGLWWGTSDNYLRVATSSPDNLTRRLDLTQLEDMHDGSLPALVARTITSPSGASAT